jgi:hypothetical protein
LKPAAAELVLTLWSLKNAGASGVEALPDPPRAGLTSFNPDPACPEAFYRAFGYHVCGPRAVRLDMLERLADVIRPLLAWRGTNGSAPPKGATGDGGFTVTPEMMSLLGCSPDELGGVLKELGFRLDRRPIKPQPAPFGHLGSEHYVLALDVDGTPRWVLATPWDIDTPPSAHLRVDGQGRLFVFPNFLVSTGETRSPVQVYSRDGELIGSGYLNRLPPYLHWQATTKDRIYGVRVNPASEEWEVVRYRLEVDGG